MFFYERIPAGQESCDRYATNATFAGTAILYYFPSSETLLETGLHAKLDRVLLLLESQKSDDEYAGLVGTMSTQDAAAFIAISKRTFERRVKEGAIRPIANNMKKNRFLKADVVQLYITYRGHKPPHLP